MPDLKPCPFCGYEEPYIRGYDVACGNCDAEIVNCTGGVEDAIENWNRRVAVRKPDKPTFADLYGFCLSAWHNRPDLFDGWKTLGRMGRELDWIQAGNPPHWNEWTADPNGRFWDEIPKEEDSKG